MQTCGREHSTRNIIGACMSGLQQLWAQGPSPRIIHIVKPFTSFYLLCATDFHSTQLKDVVLLFWIQYVFVFPCVGMCTWMQRLQGPEIYSFCVVISDLSGQEQMNRLQQHVFMCLSVYVSVCLCVYVCLYVSVLAWVNVCLCKWMCVNACICMCMWVCAYVYEPVFYV